MDKMRMESVDGTAKNIEKIEALFPNCITETVGEDGKHRKAINFDILRQMLSADVVDGNEAYEFTWVGKKAAIVEANRPIRKTLRPCPEESVNWDTTENLYIEGDNLEVLKLLQESYLGAVKMIYIDPPYNTGNDFIYPDSFVMDSEDYNVGSGYFDKEGNINFERTNGEGQGRFHSDWCSMMYSRLLLSRGLLKEDGVIFISIDDNEIDSLKNICNEVFGETNFVATFPWRKRTAKSDVPFGVSQDFEWLVCYAKSNMFKASIEGKERKYYETNDFPGRAWRFHDLTTQRTVEERPNSNYTMVNPKNGDEYPVNPVRCWAITIDTFNDYYKDNRVIFPGDYDFLNISKPVLRYWKEEDIAKAGDGFGRVAVSTKLPDEIGMSQDGTKEITGIFGGKVFSYPKPTSIIEFLEQIAMDSGDIILDFFSGSGTTAHSTMLQNSKDFGGRKYILVQLPEPCDEKSDAFKAGFHTICEIGKERIRRAGKKIKEDTGKEIDYGFRVFKLDDSNMRDVYYSADDYTQNLVAMLESNIKDDRTDLDLLFGCLLEWGLPLSLPYSSETIDGCAVHTYNDGDLVACFDENISRTVVETVAKRQPLRAVFRDSSFSDSPAKINVGEIFKLYAPDTRVKVL